MLDEILDYKKGQVQQKQASTPLVHVRAQAAAARAPRNLVTALKAPGISLIAEIKYRSPSKGVLLKDCDPLKLAQTYAENGARAISVLADEHFFGGGPHIVKAVAIAPQIEVPILFKDFIISPYQIYEARAASADAVLLIVRAVDQATLVELVTVTHELGMNALVEVFRPEEAARALAVGARIIGINNRDLKTFQVDLLQSAKIKAMLPPQVLTVSESGLHSRADVLTVANLGFDGMLVGEALVTAPDIGSRVREFLGAQELQTN